MRTTVDSALKGPVSDVAKHITALTGAQPPALSGGSVFVPTTGSICAAPRHYQDSHPHEETTDQGTDYVTGCVIEEERSSTQNSKKCI